MGLEAAEKSMKSVHDVAPEKSAKASSKPQTPQQPTAIAEGQADGVRSTASAHEPAPDLEGVQQAWQEQLQAADGTEPQPKSAVGALPVGDISQKGNAKRATRRESRGR